MMRRTTIAVVTMLIGCGGTASALAADTSTSTTTTPASDQYTGVEGSGGSGSGTPSNGTGNGNGSGNGNGTGNGNGSGNGNGTGNGNGSGGGSGGSSGAGTGAGTPAFAQAFSFGKTKTALDDAVAAAITAAGFTPQPLSSVEPALSAFLGDPIAKLLSPGGAGPAGKAFGKGVVSVTPAATQAFSALYPGETFRPVLRAVITQGTDADGNPLGKDPVKFEKGLAQGLKKAKVPVAYAELKGTKKSSIKAFKKAHILTVKDVDTPTGKLRLEKILLGEIKTQKAVDHVVVSPASAIISDSSNSSGSAPWGLVAVLLGGAAFTATGTMRRRRRTQRAS